MDSVLPLTTCLSMGTGSAFEVIRLASVGKHVEALLDIGRRGQTRESMCEHKLAWTGMGNKLENLKNLSITLSCLTRFASLSSLGASTWDAFGMRLGCILGCVGHAFRMRLCDWGAFG